MSTAPSSTTSPTGPTGGRTTNANADRIMNHIASAIGYGLLAVVIGYCSKHIVKSLRVETSEACKEECNKWNTKHVMEASLFVTGVVLYIVVQIIRAVRASKSNESYQSAFKATEEQLKPQKMDNEDTIGPDLIQKINQALGEDRMYDLYELVEAHLQRVPEKNMCIMTEIMKDKITNDKTLGNFDLVRRYQAKNVRALVSYIVNTMKPEIQGPKCVLASRPQRPAEPEY